VVTGASDGDNLQDVTALLSPQLATPAAHSWWRVTVPEINVAHQICPRDFQITRRDGGGGTTDITALILEVAIQSERVYEDGDGNFVIGATFPKPADPDDLKITDGRCACERLCDCAAYFAKVGISVLIPTQADPIDVVVKGVRDCWQISCGSCPPAKLCGRELSV